MRSKAGSPHRRHLVSQSPGLKRLEQVVQVGGDSPHFLLVIDKSARLVIRNGIVIFAHVSQHTQQSPKLPLVRRLEGTVLSCGEQRDYRPAILFHKAVAQLAPGEPTQLGLKVGRDIAAAQFFAKVFDLMRGHEMQVTGPEGRRPGCRPDLTGDNVRA